MNSVRIDSPVIHHIINGFPFSRYRSGICVWLSGFVGHPNLEIVRLSRLRICNLNIGISVFFISSMSFDTSLILNGVIVFIVYSSYFLDFSFMSIATSPPGGEINSFPRKLRGKIPYTLIEATGSLLVLSNEIVSPSQFKLPA